MGLEYPGVHHAARYGPRTGEMPSGPQPYSGKDHRGAAFAPMIASHSENRPGARSVDDRIHKQALPRGSESTHPLSRGTSSQVQSEYTADPDPRPPRGRSVIIRKSNFEGVKHAAPAVLPAAPGQSDAVSWDPQGQPKPGSFVYREHDLVVDGSAPNRHGVFWSRFSLPQSQSRGLYHRDLTGYAAAPGTAGSAKRDHDPAMSRGPAVHGMKGIQVPRMSNRFFSRSPWY